MKKMCIFDLDGTLINSIEDLAYSCNEALKQLNLPIYPIENYYQFVGNGIDKLIERILTPEHLDLFDIAKRYFNEIYDQHCLVDTKVYPGIYDLLKELKEEGCILTVVSNKPDVFVKKVIPALFPNTFDEMTGKISEIPPKPHPELVFRIMDKYAMKKENVFYIGDSDVDVYTGNNAGVKSIGVTWGFRGQKELENAGASYIVKEAMDIFKIVYHKEVAISACLAGVACRYDGKSQPCTWIQEFIKDKEVLLICPEEFGGLPTPRIPSEIIKDKVYSKEGKDVTDAFKKGAQEAIDIMNRYGCKKVILKSKSPSCGMKQIYSGQFNGTLIEGEGIFVRMAKPYGFTFYDETMEKEYKGEE